MSPLLKRVTKKDTNKSAAPARSAADDDSQSIANSTSDDAPIPATMDL